MRYAFSSESHDNGLRTLVATLDHLHTATLAICVKVGSRHEAAGDNGISHFLEHMLFRGTAKHPSAYELARSIEELGGTLIGATHVDFTLYQLTLPPENVVAGLAALGEVFRSPTFAGIDTEKRILREEILEGLDEDGADVDVEDVSRALLFSPHPLGFKITGDVANVERFGEADLRAHMRRHYVGPNIVVSVAGAVHPQAVLDSARSAFGDVGAGERSPLERPLLPSAVDRFLYVPHQGSQTDVRLSFPTFGLRDPRQTTLKLLARILDDGMSTRVHRRICEEKGLAYDAFADAEPYEDCGVFDLGATVEHGKSPEVVGELLNILAELREAPVGQGELDKARRRHGWELSALLDDDAAVACFHGTNSLLGCEDTLESLAAAAARVTARDIRDLAGELFAPGGLHLACVGMLDEGLVERTRAVFESYR